MTNTDTVEGEGSAQVAGQDTAQVAGDDTTKAEGLTAIADLKLGTSVNVLAVCTCEPWSPAVNLWKAQLADASGRICITTWGRGFKFNMNDVVAGESLQVRGYKDTNQLSIVSDSTVTVNPEPSEDVAKLKEWYQNQVSQLMSERLKEGFTPIADLTVKTNAHVLAVCTRNPWQIGKTMWKTLLRDASGQVVAMKRSGRFRCKLKDVVAIYSAHVGEFKRSPELEVRSYNSEVAVNPDLPEASKLREWYQNQVSQVEDKTITQITDLKKNTTANVLAVCTSDPMERPSLGSKRRVWQATLRDASGFMNVMKDGTNFTFGLNDVVEARGVFIWEFMLSTEIVIDENTIVTVNPATEEAKQLKEWYQNQGIRDCVKMDDVETKPISMNLVEVVQNQMQKRPSSQMKCDVCNVWCSGKYSYNNHLAGRNHQNTIAALGLDGGTVTDEGPPAKKPRSSEDPNSIVCKVCDIFVIGQVTYDAHIQGKAHAKNLRKREVAELIATNPHFEESPRRDGIQEYKCKLCQVHLGGKVTILNHLKGARHTKKAKAADALITAANAVPTAVDALPTAVNAPPTAVNAPPTAVNALPTTPTEMPVLPPAQNAMAEGPPDVDVTPE